MEFREFLKEGQSVKQTDDATIFELAGGLIINIPKDEKFDTIFYDKDKNIVGHITYKQMKALVNGLTKIYR